ncbi:MAG: hypothetical protein NC344_06595 [Bacteroidales bacterium]|nr:hypothetical protein [Bacteroidales bacterium]MCM1147487.1 hypothetical protein [Bacteroidales bacterium]MCM1206156.1 hypothetical protein [Bacillota bacterium]MCM1510012.1 hypothetical protein [Clostridium sp.]
MAIHYTRKNDSVDEQTMNVTEFIQRMVDSRRQPERHRKENNVESTK